MSIALVADAHLSFWETIHFGTDLSRTRQVTAAVVADIARRRPELVVWLGDSTHEGTAAVHAEFTRLRAALTVPDRVVLGNHDVERVAKTDFARITGGTMQTWRARHGWNLVFLDTTRELSPEDPSGVLAPSEVARLRQVIRDQPGPLVVLGHHPVSPDSYAQETQFWQAVEGFSGTGVFIGGHSHQDRYRRVKNWHLVEIASCNTAPTGYHWLELTCRVLTLRKIPVLPFDSSASSTAPGAEPSFLPLTIAADVRQS